MTASIDQQFVEFVVKSLVSNPDAVSIERRVDEKGVLLELTVHPDDLGRVIGKRGATAQSIRTLLRALGTKQEARYNLKIVDVDRIGEEGERPARDEKPRNETESTPEKSTTPSAEPQNETEEVSEKNESDALARTRAELADLDDLDI